MKKLSLKLIACFIFLLVCSTMFVYSQGSMRNISGHLQTGNASGLNNQLAATVDLTILNDEDSYNKSIASNKIVAFFQSNSPNGFKMKHEGTAPDGSKFMMGTLNTSGGNFKTYVVVKNNAIQELTFEK